MLAIKFQGDEYLLIGDLTKGGAIATREQYKHGVCSFAHLFDDGIIRQFGEPIGKVEDIEVVGETTQEVANDAICNLFVDPSWPTW